MGTVSFLLPFHKASLYLGEIMGQTNVSNKPVYRVACGGTTQDLENHFSAVYRGERIAFCTLACLKAFESDPDRFMAGEIEHPEENDHPSEHH